jgi:lipopolysaccharide biosynthesis glycosyltransferase
MGQISPPVSVFIWRMSVQIIRSNNVTKIIPIMFCFNNEYTIPAAVAFRSLLENASKEYLYKLYVLHTDISLDNQKKLQAVEVDFKEHASLEFFHMQNRFEDLWKKMRTKGHYSKEVFYKLLAPSLFPQYEKIIISDVDVVFLGDVSASYFSFGSAEDIYVAGVRGVGKILHIWDLYKKDFSQEEISKLVIGGGYLVYNLNKMRRDNLESSFLKCWDSNHLRRRSSMPCSSLSAHSAISLRSLASAYSRTV